ncbi:MAG: DUF2269 family protein [Actinomycetota bacterium]
MTLYRWLLLLHILAAMVWIGGGILLQVLGGRLARARDEEGMVKFSRDIEILGPRVFAPASLAVLGLGVGMVVVSDAWAFSQLWIVLALVAFGLSFVVGIAYFGPASKRLERAVETEGPRGSTVQRLIRQNLLVSRLDLAVLLFVVWDMVFKPGL